MTERKAPFCQIHYDRTKYRDVYVSMSIDGGGFIDRVKIVHPPDDGKIQLFITETGHLVWDKVM